MKLLRILPVPHNLKGSFCTEKYVTMAVGRIFFYFIGRVIAELAWIESVKPAATNNAINNALLNGCHAEDRVHKWLIEISFTTRLGFGYKGMRGGVIQFVVHRLWFRSVILFGQCCRWSCLEGKEAQLRSHRGDSELSLPFRFQQLIR